MSRGDRSAADTKGPVFVLGITRRCGTNYLFHLLERHPHLQPAKYLTEDFALHDAQLLFEYVDRTYGQWNPRWGFDTDTRACLVRSLGHGILSFLASDGNAPVPDQGKRLLLKTPSVRNLAHFFELFPTAYLLIMVRDGRDVVESRVRSFHCTYEVATRDWCGAAREILAFDRVQRGLASRYRIIRYENLVDDPVTSLREIIDFLELDPEIFDFEAAKHLPVYGSSTFRGDRAEVHWQPVAKTDEFNPFGRWKTWGMYRRQRFAWAAAESMAALGYPLEADDRWRAIRLACRRIAGGSPAAPESAGRWQFRLSKPRSDR